MPTYEYVCKSCGEPTEHFASMSAKPLKKCPHCGKNQLERQIGTGAGFIFKGGGFYETDYRSEGYKKAAKDDKAAAEPRSKSKSGTKSEKTSEAGKSEPSKKLAAEKKPPDPKPTADKPAPRKPAKD